MGSLRRFISDHPITIFVVLAYALSWWSIPFANGGILPQGPFLAAVILLAITKGRAGLGDLFKRMVTWRGGWTWLLIAPGLVIVYLLLALGLNLLMGAAIASTAHFSSFGSKVIILLLLGGVWEEPGWSGYALPLLQERYGNRQRGLLLASLHLGFIRAGWHLPLVLSGAIPWYDMLIFSIAFQFLITWLYNRTGGSLLIVMLFHLASNILSGGLAIPLFSGVDFTWFYILFIAMAWLLAILLVSRKNWSMGYREGDRTG